MLKIGFIGTGNMGGALAFAAARSGIEDLQLLLSNRTAEKALRLLEELPVPGEVTDNRGAARDADYIFLGVKPQFLPEVITEIREELAARRDRFTVVSMAAGWDIERLQKALGMNYPVIRIMPNTPALIGEGMTLYTASPEVTAAETDMLLTLLSASGRLTAIRENLMDAASAVTGCGPAFADIFVSALAEGIVSLGIPRREAINYAAQMLVGSGRLILESGKHPEELKDAVCSPGGSTIQGVIALEEDGFRAAVIHAVEAAYEKSREL